MSFRSRCYLLVRVGELGERVGYWDPLNMPAPFLAGLY